MDIPALKQLQELQTRCNNNETLDPKEVKKVIEAIMFRVAYADQIYDICAALHREEKNRTIMVDEYHEVMVFCRRMAYHVMKRIR